MRNSVTSTSGSRSSVLADLHAPVRGRPEGMPRRSPITVGSRVADLQPAVDDRAFLIAFGFLLLLINLVRSWRNPVLAGTTLGRPDPRVVHLVAPTPPQLHAPAPDPFGAAHLDYNHLTRSPSGTARSPCPRVPIDQRLGPPQQR